MGATDSRACGTDDRPDNVSQRGGSAPLKQAPTPAAPPPMQTSPETPQTPQTPEQPEPPSSAPPPLPAARSSSVSMGPEDLTAEVLRLKDELAAKNESVEYQKRLLEELRADYAEAQGELKHQEKLEGEVTKLRQENTDLLRKVIQYDFVKAELQRTSTQLTTTQLELTKATAAKAELTDEVDILRTSVAGLQGQILSFKQQLHVVNRGSATQRSDDDHHESFNKRDTFDRLPSRIASELAKNARGSLHAPAALALSMRHRPSATGKRRTIFARKDVWDREREAELRFCQEQAYDIFDKVASGQIDPMNQQALQGYSIEMSKKYWERHKKLFCEIWDKYDANSDGLLSREECGKLVRDSLLASQRMSYEELENVIVEMIQLGAANEQARAETRARVREMPIAQIIQESTSKLIDRADQLASELYAKLDKNQDGEVTKQEFLEEYAQASAELITCNDQIVKTIMDGVLNASEDIAEALDRDDTQEEFYVPASPVKHVNPEPDIPVEAPMDMDQAAGRFARVASS